VFLSASASQLGSPPPEPAPPAIEVRILAWLLIYLAGLVPIIYRPDFDFSLGRVWTFPANLGLFTRIVLNSLPSGTPLAAVCAILGFYVLPYGIFAFNFYGLLRARTRHRSSRLLLLLVLLVLFTQFLLALKEHPPIRA
jgi:hypothetical protein